MSDRGVCRKAPATLGLVNYILSKSELDSGYTVNYRPLPSGVPMGFALKNSLRQRAIIDCISLVLDTDTENYF